MVPALEAPTNLGDLPRNLVRRRRQIERARLPSLRWRGDGIPSVVHMCSAAAATPDGVVGATTERALR